MNLINKIPFIKVYLFSVFYLAILGFVKYGLKGVAIAIVAAIPISALTMVIADRCGQLSSRLFLGSKSERPIEEIISADLSRAKVQKMNKNYEEALLIIETVLAQVPENGEALFLKAQILLDGYNDIDGAKTYFTKVLEHEPEDSSLYRWAKNSKIEIETNQSKE